MRHFESPNLPIVEPLGARRSGAEGSSLAYILGIARRRKWLLVIGVLIGLVAGAAYFVTAKPKFTATAFIMLDGKSSDDSKETEVAAPTVDTAELDSQVEVIRSRAVAEVMIKNLDTEQRKQLAAESTSASRLRPLLAKLMGKPAAPNAVPGEAAPNPDLVLRGLAVSRVDRTYVVSINYIARSPDLAAAVANGFADAFESVLSDRRLASARRKIEWIEQRVEEARAASVQADAALQGFRLSSEVGASDAAKHELELKADNFRKLYQTLLQRKQRALDELTFPRDEFRTITPAEPPSSPTSPKLPFVIVISLLLGGGGAAVAAGLLEMIDQTFRTSGQIEELLGLRFLGWLPMIRNRKGEGRVLGESEGEEGSSERKFPAVLRHSTDNPRSRYAETLRAIRAAASLVPPRDATKVIGIVSALPSEGKSTLAINFGRLLAREGTRVLVIDGDLRNRDFSKIAAPSAANGLYQALGDGQHRPPLADLLLTDATSGMRMLAITDPNVAARNTNSQLVVRFDALLSEAKTMFEVIIVDLPPLAAVADARTLAALCDCFVLVVDWGKTHRGAVGKFVDSERGMRDRLLGVVLNKVNLAKLRLYEQGNDPQYHAYRRYFSDT